MSEAGTTFAFKAGVAVRVLGTMLPDLIGLVGASLTAFGAGEIYRPAGYIVGGLMLVAASLLAARATV